MTSVTQRIKQIKQPWGGYIKPSSMKVTSLDDGKTLNEEENIHASIIGMAVDYMTRFLMGSNIEKAFQISILGSQIAEQFFKVNSIKEAEGYLKEIKGLDDNSIINACKISTFDVWFRNPFNAILAKDAREINPDIDTIDNIKILIERSISFWNHYGPIKVDGFTFEEKGYTETVDAGDGDFLTEDTIWDFKVSKKPPKSNHTLQLLMYYIMGKHSGKPEFNGIKKIGIFNPRLNNVYLYDISDVSPEIIKSVEDDVICY